MSNALTHPKCGKRFANNSMVGHCSGCCETFYGLRAFDKHRKGGVCNELTEARGFWTDDKGQWHWGQRMTPEQKARIRKCDDDAEQ